jgi:hypothetical protein
VTRWAERLFLATLFCVSFEKIQWNVAGTVTIADVLTVTFLIAFALSYRDRVPRSAGILLLFLAAFLLVYLIGFYNLDTKQALDQFTKGFVKWLLHFLFLVAGVVLLSGRARRFYWRALGVFTAGLVANAAYGVLQLLVARAGGNLDQRVLSPITGGASSINIYGAINGANVYRPNALTSDPNHLGVMLLVPLLTLTPLYLMLERGNRWRLRLAIVLSFLLLMEVATLSRSGLLGLACGAVVLFFPYRRIAWSGALLWPLTGVAAVIVAVAWSRRHYVETIVRSRIQVTGANGTSAHFGVYDFIPQIVHLHPLFGLGLNNFSVYYEFVTGKTNWGPHSFYVSVIVETGLVGATLFALFLVYVFQRLDAARRIGRALAAVRDPLSDRVDPLAWGMTAALVGTMVANLFYLTMSFYYFYAFVALAVALPGVFARRA